VCVCVCVMDLSEMKWGYGATNQPTDPAGGG
jgi:hypothetical protein